MNHAMWTGCCMALLAVLPAWGIPPVHIDVEAKPARQISEYHLFKDPKRQIPNAGLVKYDLNTPLFSDYSSKHRFVYVPPGETAAYHPRDAFAFPVGSVIVKTFSFLADLRDPAKGERIIETRLLIRKPEGWVGLPYIWNEETTDARLAVAGGRADVSWVHHDGARRDLNYIIPNMNECKQCHENNDVMGLIGPKARHLNKPFPYASGKENQLTHWRRLGILTGGPDDPEDAPRAAVFDEPASGSVDARARAWLDINCAHCHNPDGPAYTSGLDLSHDQQDPARFGVMKPPVAAGRGSGNLRFGIHPGKPGASILFYRVASTDPSIMMPPLPRRQAPEEGLALLREWIAAMKDGEENPAR